MISDIVTVKVSGTDEEYPMKRETYETYKEEMNYELVAEVPKKVKVTVGKPTAKKKTTAKKPKAEFSIED